MKRRDLIIKLEENGYYLLRHGSNHDIYTNDEHSEPIARHKEITETTAKAIIKRCNLK